MFENLSNRMKAAAERREQQREEEYQRLMNLSEKELMVEMLLELREINSKCDDIRRKIVLYSN